MNFVQELDLELRDCFSTEGHHGEIWRGYDPQLDGIFAVKRIPVGKFTDFKQYHEEARKLYLSQHPNIVQVQYGCRDADFVNLVMPLYEKGSLAHVLASGLLTVRQAIQYALDFLTGLKYVHMKGLAHLDVRPPNILIDDSGRALLADFGVAKALDMDGQAETKYVFMSHRPPEMIGALASSRKSDIYQAGVTLYEMVNGSNNLKRQFHSHNNIRSAIANGSFPDRRSYLPHIPQRVRTAINKALSIDPDDRHDTVIDLMNDLARVDSHLDWQMRVENGPIYSWERSDDTRKITIIAKIKPGTNAQEMEIESKKHIFSTSNTQRITAGCVPSVAFGQAKSAVKRIISGLE